MQQNQERKLNVDIAGAIAELQEMLKEFRIKKEIFKLFFRGKGLEFETYRDFTPDDDASMIDWKTSSRAQKLLVKQYKEERDLEIFFMVDVGDSMVFGSTPKIKCEFATELAAAFARVLYSQNDKIGYVLFSDTIKHFDNPKGGEKQFSIFVDHMTKGINYGGTTNLDFALDFALDNFKKTTASVIIISDFLNVTGETEKKLGLLASKFETISIRVRDPLDITLPDIEGEIVLENPGTHDQIIINPKVAKATYEKYAAERGKIAEGIIKRTQSDYLDLVTDKSFAVPLAIFLKERIEGH